MKHLVALGSRLAFIGLLATVLQANAQVTSPKAVASEAKNKVVFQVSDDDEKKWALTLNNIANLQKDLGQDNVEIELVAYGPGLGILKKQSAMGSRIKSALASDVKVMACENTMQNQKLTRADMLPAIGYVPAGVTEIMLKQQQGYAYIRP